MNYTMCTPSMLIRNLLLLAGVILSFPLQAASNELTANQKTGLQIVIDDMKKAIRQRDFSKFRQDTPLPSQAKPVKWYQCTEKWIADLSYDDLIKILNDRLGSGPINIKPYPKYLYSGYMAIETTGWRSELPFIDFKFGHSGNGFLLMEISACAERLPDLDSESRGTKIPPQVGALLNAIQQKNMHLLRPLITERRTYGWGYCGPGHTAGETLYFEDLVTRLKNYSGSARISFPSDVELSGGWEDVLFNASLDSTGWRGTYKYLEFSFGFLKSTGRWEWNGVCESELPAAVFRGY